MSVENKLRALITALTAQQAISDAEYVETEMLLAEVGRLEVMAAISEHADSDRMQWDEPELTTELVEMSKDVRFVTNTYYEYSPPRDELLSFTKSLIQKGYRVPNRERIVFEGVVKPEVYDGGQALIAHFDQRVPVKPQPKIPTNQCSVPEEEGLFVRLQSWSAKIADRMNGDTLVLGKDINHSMMDDLTGKSVRITIETIGAI